MVGKGKKLVISLSLSSVLPKSPTSERDLYAPHPLQNQGVFEMNRYHRTFGDLRICEGTTDFFGDALRATTLEWRYYCGA